MKFNKALLIREIEGKLYSLKGIKFAFFILRNQKV